MFSRERECWRAGGRLTWRVCNYPLEPYPFRRQRKRRTKGARRAGRALPNLLATRFLVRLQTWLFHTGRAGPYAGFFYDHSEEKLVAPRRSKSRSVPLAVAQVAPKFSC